MNSNPNNIVFTVVTRPGINKNFSGFSGINGNYIVFSVTVHDKYELWLTETCRGKYMYTLSHTPTLLWDTYKNKERLFLL